MLLGLEQLLAFFKSKTPARDLSALAIGLYYFFLSFSAF